MLTLDASFGLNHDRSTRRSQSMPADRSRPMLPGRISLSRRWSVLQNSRAANDRSADQADLRSGCRIRFAVLYQVDSEQGVILAVRY